MLNYRQLRVSLIVLCVLCFGSTLTSSAQNLTFNQMELNNNRNIIFGVEALPATANPPLVNPIMTISPTFGIGQNSPCTNIETRGETESVPCTPGTIFLPPIDDEDVGKITAMPEPSTWLLVGLSLLMLGAVVWQKRQTATGDEI